MVVKELIMKIRKEIKMIIPIIIFISLVVVISLFSSNQANVSNAIKLNKTFFISTLP
jgi:hypothetical protein